MTDPSLHRRLWWRWVRIEPSWRDPDRRGPTRRRVRCRACDDEVLGITIDPVEALQIARRHRRIVRAQP